MAVRARSRGSTNTRLRFWTGKNVLNRITYVAFCEEDPVDLKRIVPGSDRQRLTRDAIKAVTTDRTFVIVALPPKCTVGAHARGVVVDTYLGCKKGCGLNSNFELFEFSNFHRTLNFRTHGVPKHRE